MTIFRFSSYLFLMACFCLGCKSKKIAVIDHGESGKAAIIGEVESVVKQLQSEDLSFRTFSSKAKAQIAVNNERYDANVSIRVDNGKKIWISITAFLGIEVARVLITPDRIAVVNRLEKTVLDQPYVFLQKLIGAPLSYGELQSILLGNSTVLAGQLYKLGVAKNQLGFLVNANSEIFNYQVQADEWNKVLSIQIDEQSGKQSLVSSYGEFTELAGQRFAQLFQLTIKAPHTEIKTLLTYGTISINEALQTPFQIPQSYKALP